MTFPSVFENNADSIGFTPLVRLNRVLSSDAKARVYAKMESRKPRW